MFAQEIAQRLPAIAHLGLGQVHVHKFDVPCEQTAVLVGQWLEQQHCAEDSELSTGESRNQTFSCKSMWQQIIPGSVSISTQVHSFISVRGSLNLCGEDEDVERIIL